MFRPVGIGSVDQGISLFCGNLPEPSVGIVPVLSDTQKVHFQRNAALLAEAAKSGHLIIVKGRISAEIDEIRMGKIEKSACLQCLFALAAVKPQIIFSVPRFPVIAVSFIFVVDVVLTQKKVLNGIGFYQTKQPLP